MIYKRRDRRENGFVGKTRAQHSDRNARKNGFQKLNRTRRTSKRSGYRYSRTKKRRYLIRLKSAKNNDDLKRIKNDCRATVDFFLRLFPCGENSSVRLFAARRKGNFVGRITGRKKKPKEKNFFCKTGHLTLPRRKNIV